MEPAAISDVVQRRQDVHVVLEGTDASASAAVDGQPSPEADPVVEERLLRPRLQVRGRPRTSEIRT